MSNIIDFPDNYNRLLEKAAEYYEQKAYEDAAALYGQAYSMKPDIRLNQLISSVYLENNDPERALEFMQDYKEVYENEVDYQLFYVSVLIENQLFEQAHELIGNQLSEESDETDATNWQSALRLLEERVSQEEKQLDELLEETKKKLYSLSSFDLEEQLKTVEFSALLNKETLETAAKIHFVNPYVHHFAKVGLLENLIENQDRHVYDLEWNGEIRQILPFEIPLFQEQPLVIQIKNELENKLEKNPSLFSIIDSEVRYHLMCLYPFLEDVVTDAGKWVNIYLDKYGSLRQDLREDEETKAMEKWVERLTAGEFNL